MLPFNLVTWLLSAETPTIHYLTARDLLGLPESDPLVQVTRQAIMTRGIVPAILSKQMSSGQWASEAYYYSPKYRSTHWTLTYLTELCIEPTDEQFQRGVEYMLDATVERMDDSLAKGKKGFSCFWGNLLRYALYAGRADDPRVQAIIGYVVKDLTDANCRCQYNSGYSCAWGVVRSLWGLAALPQRETRRDVQLAISQALVFLLRSFSLIEANYPTSDNGKVHPVWFKLNFPLFYQADILFTLRVLADLDALSCSGTAAALDWLQALRLPNGHWQGSSPFRQRTWHQRDDAAETARWVSLHSALVLQQAKRAVAGSIH